CRGDRVSASPVHLRRPRAKKRSLRHPFRHDGRDDPRRPSRPAFIEPSETDEVRQHDILEGPPEAGAFDVVHARAVVEWVTDRPKALATMVAALKPGGVLLVEDVDIEPSRICYPPNELRSVAIEAFITISAAVGADLALGPQLQAEVVTGQRFTSPGYGPGPLLTPPATPGSCPSSSTTPSALLDHDRIRR
ncbi:MAG: trans-aconitate 2-methyltransferase, partial [Jatrophihabitans sp.]|uniref:class I SAM-dependent methyltransferase n=1 Tax=Jatrophihabitans sp. TaxID=1932789 RepID=UPI00391558FE